jgi:hypothetical protein
LHYKLKHEERHNFIFPLSEVLILDNQRGVDKNSRINPQRQSDKEIILQTTKLDGMYTVEVKLEYYSKVIYKF